MAMIKAWRLAPTTAFAQFGHWPCWGWKV